jgi:restriction system protein
MSRRRRYRRRRSNAGASGPLLFLGVAGVAALYTVGRSASGWASQHRGTAFLLLAVVLGTGGVLGMLVLRAQRVARQQREEQDRIKLARKIEQRRRGEWWDQLSDKQFEHEVASLARRDGCQARVCGGAGDGGVDIEGTTADGRKFVIQCKHYAATSFIGAKEVRDFRAGALLKGASLMLLVTTTERVSRQAADHARRFGIELVTRNRLLAWAQGRPLQMLSSPPTSDTVPPAAG